MTKKIFVYFSLVVLSLSSTQLSQATPLSQVAPESVGMSSDRLDRINIRVFFISSSKSQLYAVKSSNSITSSCPRVGRNVLGTFG